MCSYKCVQLKGEELTLLEVTDHLFGEYLIIDKMS